jgi:hypothetical protein
MIQIHNSINIMPKSRPHDEYAKTKDMKRGVITQKEQLHKGKKNQVKKIWAVYSKVFALIDGQFTYIDKWVVVKKFAILQDAEQWVSKNQRNLKDDVEKIYRIEELD